MQSETIVVLNAAGSSATLSETANGSPAGDVARTVRTIAILVAMLLMILHS